MVRPNRPAQTAPTAPSSIGTSVIRISPVGRGISSQNLTLAWAEQSPPPRHPSVVTSMAQQQQQHQQQQQQHSQQQQQGIILQQALTSNNGFANHPEISEQNVQLLKPPHSPHVPLSSLPPQNLSLLHKTQEQPVDYAQPQTQPPSQPIYVMQQHHDKKYLVIKNSMEVVSPGHVVNQDEKYRHALINHLAPLPTLHQVQCQPPQSPAAPSSVHDKMSVLQQVRIVFFLRLGNAWLRCG